MAIRKRDRLKVSLTERVGNIEQKSPAVVMKMLTRKPDESSEQSPDLYEYAPVGYITLDEKGKITECNLIAPAVLGVERDALRGMNFGSFVPSEFRKHWNLQRKAAFASGDRQACDVELRRMDGIRIAVRMEGLVSGTKGNRRCHV